MENVIVPQLMHEKHVSPRTTSTSTRGPAHHGVHDAHWLRITRRLRFVSHGGKEVREGVGANSKVRCAAGCCCSAPHTSPWIIPCGVTSTSFSLPLLRLFASTQDSSQRLRVKMGASSRLMVSTIALVLVAASRAAVASMDASACAELGFTSGLECATCDALHKHVNHDGTCARSAGSTQFRVWLLCCARGHQRVVGSVRAADSSCVGFAHVACRLPGLLAECQSCCSSGDGSVSSYVYAQLRVCS